MEALGSCLTNKYSEGYPNARYFYIRTSLNKHYLIIFETSYVVSIFM